MTRIARIFLPTFLLAGLAGLAAPAAAQTQTRMSGVVKDHEGKPLRDVKVRMEAILKDDPAEEAEESAKKAPKGVTVETSSKKDGRYFFGMMRPGSYKLAVEAPGELVVIHMTGKAVDTRQNKAIVWEVDQDLTLDLLPPINVGSGHQIDLDLVLGPPSMTPEAKQQAAVQEAQDAYSRGVAKVKAGDAAGALQELEPLLEGSPDHPGTNYLVSFARNQLGRHEAALSAVDKVLDVEPGFSGAHVLRGRILQGLGRDQEAENEFEKEVDLTTDPNIRMEAMVALAILYEKTGRIEKAIETLEKASEDEPQKDVLLKLSSLYAGQGNAEKAAQVLERAAEEAGGLDDAGTVDLAVARLNEQRYDDAEKLASRVAKKADALKSHRSIAHSVLARCSLNKGKLDEGANHLEQALELDSSTPLAKENREILNALRKK